MVVPWEYIFHSIQCVKTHQGHAPDVVDSALMSRFGALKLVPSGQDSGSRGASSSGNMNAGLALSDRWCVVTLLVDLLKYIVQPSSSSSPSSYAVKGAAGVISLQENALKSLGAIISTSSPDMYTMLLAQQVPTAICTCLKMNISKTTGGMVMYLVVEFVFVIV